MMRRVFLTATPLSCLMLASPFAATAQDTNGGKITRFHDPSTPIRQQETWHIFSTGNGISTRTSTDLESWKEGPPVFKELPAWHRDVVSDHKGYLWAPDIIRQGGRYLLYYSVSGWGKNTSAIGLASSPTLDSKDPAYQWKDEGIVIRSGKEDAYNAIDPQLFADTDGRLWMVFGSFWTGIQLTELDAKTGLRHPENRKIHQLAWHESIEAAALLKHDGFYYLFVNWGLCCRGVDSTYEMRVGRSKEITGPYLDAAGNELVTGGGTLFMQSEGNRIGPGHPSFIREKDAIRMFFHYYDGNRRGHPTLGDATLEWNDNGWPKAGNKP
ncbi:arabinan endo-1,5-alpha-L-arabinosidase [Luteolibacter yonseiensis]|uniref:Arabinan endo-1,5-alpha-L-arabinosidase n=2 Tax=Luteolibacter yonseiensis TaxID=1144680 RepID=A0A934VDC7_9BACT|nr:arabinan endo-1,5-alpha-L-arabinosidase [Luteolibacter yonseiensis]MBK1817881.1 arabinan endo-1,5-alpha-L-arabinosidase [Luteolibacter yonseiensis]